jgi:hypothetical protein
VVGPSRVRRHAQRRLALVWSIPYRANPKHDATCHCHCPPRQLSQSLLGAAFDEIGGVRGGGHLDSAAEPHRLGCEVCPSGCLCLCMPACLAGPAIHLSACLTDCLTACWSICYR